MAEAVSGTREPAFIESKEEWEKQKEWICGLR